MNIRNYLKNPVLYCYLALYNRNKSDWIPDKIAISLLFKYRMGKRLRWSSPQTFNEKIQWLKLNDRRSDYSEWADKYEAKCLVAKLLGEEYVVPNYGVYCDVNEIEWNKLPEQYVLKCTHDCGSIEICRNAQTFDWKAAGERLENSLKKNYYFQSREWCYKNIRPRIIVEKYLSVGDDEGIDDYKIFCFSGEARFLYISHGLENHSTAMIGFYDLDGNELSFSRNDYRPYHNAKRPSNFKRMIEIANRIASKIDNAFVRVDLYSVKGNIYFSEATFYPCSGMMPFEPYGADVEVGQMLDLSYKGKKNDN